MTEATRGGDNTSPLSGWHDLATEKVLDALGSVIAGLSRDEATRRRARYGPNLLPRPKRPGLAAIYIRQFRNPLIYLLLAAAAVSLWIGEVTDAVFIFGVLQFNAFVGTVQEWRAATHAEALDRLVKSWIIVRRDGHRTRIDSVDLVPGDVVELESGTQVPADIRLLETRDLAMDQSLLTGESLPVAKDAASTHVSSTPVAERANMIHAGTTVLRGRATGVVVGTAANTEIGRIAQALAAEKPAPAPLVVRLDRFTRAIGVVMVGAIALLGLALYLQGMAAGEIFLVAVALAVAAIPEGLPVAITIALAVGTRRMALRNVIVRSLPAVEGLGACTLIASDKTGTLTCNELTIKRLFLPDLGEIDVGGEGYAPVGRATKEECPLDAQSSDAVERIAIAGALCNEASLRVTADGVSHVGDTVDVAFLVLAAKLGLDQTELLDRFPQADSIPFEPARRFAASFNWDGDRRLCFVKGAAEEVLPMCSGVDRAAILAETHRMAESGYRILAVAAGDAKEDMGPSSNAAELNEFSFLGLVGLIDPLRPEAPPAVESCRQAGIDVRMVTGDHPATALAIARQLGIADESDGVVVGSTLAETVASEQMHWASARVFARVEPLQKLTIVEALQRGGHFVAVTGDGVNDAPALRAAHIGVAMGRTGTDVARDAADLILADDNFASIVGGVEEGRVAYDNVRKVVLLLISTGAAEITLFFLTMVAGLPLPLFAAQLLWLNVVTQGIQDVALAFERGEPGILARPPRPPDQPIFDRRMIEQTIVSGLYMGFLGFLFFYWALDRGWTEDNARNVLLLLMVLFINMHILNCRSESRSIIRIPLAANPWVLMAAIAAQVAHIVAMYTPGHMQTILDLRPVEASTWFAVAGLALSILAVMEVYKRVRPLDPGRSGGAVKR